MLVLIAALLVVIFVIIYIRHFPVIGVKCVSLLDIDKESAKPVDVRGYNESYKDLIQGSITIPVAYFKRNYREITSQEIHIIASSYLEKNVGIRFLRRKGFKVAGYTLTDCDCKINKFKKQRTGKEHSYGIQ